MGRRHHPIRSTPSSWRRRGRAFQISLLVLASLFLLDAAVADETAPGSDPATANSSPPNLATETIDGEGAAERYRSQARAAEARGDAQAATTAWIRLAEAQQALGDYGLAVETLNRALASARARGDEARFVAALRGARGNLYLAVARPADARRELEAALALARQAGATGTAATIENNLGNQLATEGDFEAAIGAYQRAARDAEADGQPGLAARAFANGARAQVEAAEPKAARSLVTKARALLENQPSSREKASLLVHLARTLELLREAGPGEAEQAKASLLESHALLVEADAMAAEHGDPRTGSYAQGMLGGIYASRGRRGDALELTKRAIADARTARAPEIRYRWHAQAARLLALEGQNDRAIGEYASAVALLEELRHTMAVRYGRSDLSFRERVGGIYFGYVDLLLRRAATAEDDAPDLALALQVLEQLKAAELRDYFQDECVDDVLGRSVSVAEVSPRAAIIYPVLLEDRIELLVSTRTSNFRTSVPIGLAEATTTLREFRRTLERRTTRQYLRPARQLYTWLIEPIQPALDKSGVDTLVFVPDGALRTVPMSALHDGEHFLVERYAVAITPSLRLTDPKPLDPSRARVFAGGLTESVQGFEPLPHVGRELGFVGSLFETELLVDADFQRARVEQQLADSAFNVVHIASHASFDSRTEETFVLTHDGRLSMDDLASYVGLFRFRDQPLDLLMLSACETAAGDDRAALGLSGLAVKAGARSAVGTLWAVNDEASTVLVSGFYQALKAGELGRAEALRSAQRTLIEDRRFVHPAYWSAFILISNWL